MLNQKYDSLLKHKTELDTNIGKLLNNRYLIRDLIGKGRVGRVYLAEDTAKGGTLVALKILFLSLVDQQISQQFAKEVLIATQLGCKSNNIVRILGYGVTEAKNPFYIMEYLQGKNLKHIIHSRSLTLSNFLNICHQICLGLRCAHTDITLKEEVYPIIHRDLKPENIFITDDIKKGEIIKILDFGIANFLAERSQLAFTESLIHNLPYCSPEYMEGHKLLDIRADIYSLGIIMYEMLVGKHPFYAKNNTFGSWYEVHRFQSPVHFQEIIPQFEIPQILQELILSCLAKNVTLRPQNIDEIITIIEKIHCVPKRNFINSEITLLNQNIKIDLVSTTSLSEKICCQEKWPKNKPIAPICFPYLLHTAQGNIPTIMAMLPKKEINKFIKQSHHTEFIVQTDLYPMLLWITILESPKLELVRWLSCFLDLKDNKNLEILQALSKLGYYHLLFFPLEKPANHPHVMTIVINADQRQELTDCLELCQLFKPIISPRQSKAILKLKFDNLKQELLHKIANTSNKKIFKINLLKYLDKLVYILLRDNK